MNTFKRLFCVLLTLATLSATAALSTDIADNGVQITVCGVQRLTAGTDFDPAAPREVCASTPPHHSGTTATDINE